MNRRRVKEERDYQRTKQQFDLEQKQSKQSGEMAVGDGVVCLADGLATRSRWQ
jgi:hypothetical protein